MSRYDYVVDVAGRRTVAVLSGSLTNARRAFGANPEGDRVHEQVCNNFYAVEASATNSYTATTGRVFVAKTPEVFTYDADGNMTSDGRFTYEWNAENRLEKVKTLLSGLPTNVPVIKLVLNYDHQGRRISMVRSKYEGGAWVWLENRKFIYDGWNLVGETRNANSVTVTNWYVWGLDLSGTLQGAGGVGGLLNASFGGATPLANYIAYDGNGNVTDLIGGNGAKRAHYEYDPFGNATTETGTLAASNPFRFSTKYWDEDSKLSYYGYRYYGPGMGRWLSRDPINEDGGESLYLANLNNAINENDKFGLVCCSKSISAKLQYPTFSVYSEGGYTYKVGNVILADVTVTENPDECSCWVTEEAIALVDEVKPKKRNRVTQYNKTTRSFKCSSGWKDHFGVKVQVTDQYDYTGKVTFTINQDIYAQGTDGITIKTTFYFHGSSLYSTHSPSPPTIP